VVQVNKAAFLAKAMLGMYLIVEFPWPAMAASEAVSETTKSSPAWQSSQSNQSSQSSQLNQAGRTTQVGETSQLDVQTSSRKDETKEEKKEEKKELKEEKKKTKAEEKLHSEKDATGSVSSATISAADPHSVPCISWIDHLVKPRACLLCIHGLGLYSGSYTNFGKWMARRGVATYAIDVRGFGSWMKLSDEKNMDFKGCLNDIKITIKSIRAANPGLPVYLLGESMGGAIALKAAALFPDMIDGLVSSVPAGERFKQKKTDLIVALEFLTGPNKQHDMGKSVVHQATADGKLREDWEDNPMDRMNFSAKQLMEFQKFMNENHDAAKLIDKTPVLMLQGSEDKLVKPEGTWEIYNELSVTDKMLFVVPSEHLIFEEQQDHAQKFDEKVSRAVLTWLQTHLPANYKWSENLTASDQTRAMSKIFNNNYAGAKKDLDDAITLDPTDAKAYFLRGLVDTKLNQTAQAKSDYAKAASLGHGSESSRQATALLLKLGQSKTDSIAQDDQTNGFNIALDQTMLNSLGVSGKPAILAFYAPWAEQCKDIDKLSDQNVTLHNMQICKVNVDDPKFGPMVSACSVGPIPTFVYVTAKGNVAGMNIGMNNFANFAKILTANPLPTSTQLPPPDARSSK
jgi:alpha-beta hydrolase superfamily lysophospholipase